MHSLQIDVKVLALIPARGASKGIPQKNIKSLAGTAKRSKLVNRIVVSTDSKKIGSIAKKFGAEVPFYRPKGISRDNSSTQESVKHALNFLEKNKSYTPDIVVILQPTSPFRKDEIIDKAIRKLKREKADIVLGISKIKTHPYRAFWPNDKFLKPFKRNFLKYYQRQMFPTCYYPTGEIYVFWTRNLEKFGNIYGSKIQGIIKPENEISSDINNLFDLFICEMRIKYWKRFQKQFK